MGSMARISGGGTTTAALEIPFDGKDTLELLEGCNTNSGREDHGTKTNLDAGRREQ